MRNRILQVRMIKNVNDEPATPGEPDTEFEEKVAIIGRCFERVIDKAGHAALSYIILDTIRKVMVAKASK